MEIIGRCAPEAWVEALTVLYQRTPASRRPQLVAEACAEARRGRLDLAGLWVARRRGRIVAVLPTQRLPGPVAAVWPPEVAVRWQRAPLAARLVQAALDAFRADGVRLAQALIDMTAARRQGGRDLQRGGMFHATDLVFLARDTATTPTVPPAAPSFVWKAFEPRLHDEFQAVLEATYQGSLDMPELEPVRNLDDLLAAHRADEHRKPERWQLGRVPGEPGAAAVLMLGAAGDRPCWELAYLGLTPAARGRGLGRVAVAHAVALARPHAPRLELGVDVRNLPARKLYRAAGFHPFDRRAVFLAAL